MYIVRQNMYGGGSPSGAAGGDLTGTYPNPTIAANAVGNTKIRQGVARSVIGRSASSTGDVADIQATTSSNAVLRESGGSIGFGPLTSGAFPSTMKDGSGQNYAIRTLISSVGGAAPSHFINSSQGINVSESIPRTMANTSTYTLVNLKPYFVKMDVIEGQVITNISFRSANTAAGTPTHWWFALYDSTITLIAQTADQTTTAWGAYTNKTLALSGAHTVTSGQAAIGYLYAAVCMEASVMNNIVCGSCVQGFTPYLCFQATSAIASPGTTAPTGPVAVDAENYLIPYCRFS